MSSLVAVTWLWFGDSDLGPLLFLAFAPWMWAGSVVSILRFNRSLTSNEAEMETGQRYPLVAWQTK